MMDYARLVHAAWDESGTPIRVFGPAPIVQITDGYFGPHGVMSHDLRARTEMLPSQEVWKARGGTLPRPWPAPQVSEITPGFTFQADGWTLKSCEVPHVQPALDCMGFSVESGGKKFVYSGDAGLCDDLTTMMQNADLLLHWCYRLDGEATHPTMVPLTPTPSEIAHLAREAGVKRLLLTHFRVHMDAPEKHAEALSTLQYTFGSAAGIVEDLDCFEI